MDKLLKIIKILDLLEEYGLDEEQVETIHAIISEFDELNNYRKDK